MLYIYKYRNKINGKVYIGQTNNIQKRINGHKSVMNNPKDHSYNDAFHAALRKYGYENFSFEIIEEFDDSFGREYLNEREVFFIEYYNSHVSKNGYNITYGGDGCNKEKLTFPQRCARSKIFTETEIRDIQERLIEGYQYFEIKRKYPKLTDSFLTNINCGLNFYRDDLNYPLAKFHTRFHKETMKEIKEKIKEGVAYSKISEEYGISASYLSEINNGHKWFDKEEKYPLNEKKCANKVWQQQCVYDILFTSLSYREIGEKYHRTIHAVKSIAQGSNFYKPEFKYSLRKYLEENQRTFFTIFK